jgi:hypothetical protein
MATTSSSGRSSSSSAAAIPGLYEPQTPTTLVPSDEPPSAEMDENEKIMALVQGAGGWHDDLKCARPHSRPHLFCHSRLHHSLTVVAIVVVIARSRGPRPRYTANSGGSKGGGGFVGGPTDNRLPPPGYTCHRCNEPGAHHPLPPATPPNHRLAAPDTKTSPPVHVHNLLLACTGVVRVR